MHQPYRQVFPVDVEKSGGGVGPHFKAAMSQMRHLLAGVPEIINVEVSGDR
jgi:hypothetical protein